MFAGLSKKCREFVGSRPSYYYKLGQRFDVRPVVCVFVRVTLMFVPWSACSCVSIVYV